MLQNARATAFTVSELSRKNQTFPSRLGLNGRNIPYIPPLFHDNKFIADFKENSEIFTSFIAEQYSLIDNVNALPSPFLLITDKSLSDVDFSKKDIKSIRKLDLSKAHDYKMVSTCMPKYCNKSICRPLYVTFKSCLTQGNARHFTIGMVKRKCTNVQIKKTRQKVC